MIPSKISRINIIGTSGSGKTTSSLELAQKLNLPLNEMEKVFWGLSRINPPILALSNAVIAM